MCRHCVSGRIQAAIDRAPALPVVEPEWRIAQLNKRLDDKAISGSEAEQIREQILVIEALIDPGRRTTSYTPDPHLKGGIG